MLNRIYTIGHSTRTLDELAALLRSVYPARRRGISGYPATTGAMNDAADVARGQLYRGGTGDPASPRGID